MVIATWNVENFSSAAPNFEQKLEYIAAAIEHWNPDVIALQEVLDASAAAQLGARLGYEVTLGAPDARGIRVAFLTRDPPSNHQILSEWRLPSGALVQTLDGHGQVRSLTQMPRPTLKLTWRGGSAGAVVDFINVHLKSKLLEFPGGRFSPKDESERASVAHFALQRRAAEATTTREHASDLLRAGHHLVVLGDLNDGPDAATTEMLYGPIGSQPNGPEDARQASSSFNRLDKDEGSRLFNITRLLPPEKRWSRRYAGQKELIDHILVSASLMPRVDGRFGVPEVEIWNDEAPMRWAEPVTNGVQPDHAPVVARFD